MIDGAATDRRGIARLKPAKRRVPTLTLRWVGLLLLLFSVLASAAPGAFAADELDIATAPVVVDGQTLFSVRGVSAFPAPDRAEAIADRIRAAAADSGTPTSTLRVIPGERSSDIVMGDRVIMVVLDGDAALEGIHRHDLARAYAQKIGTAVEAYRRDRSPRKLLVGAAMSLAATVALVVGLVFFFRFWRRLGNVLASRYARRVHSLEIRSVQVIHADQVRALARATHRIVRTLVLLAVAYLYLSFVLARFPWTRPTAARLLGYVLTPLARMGQGVLAFLPNLVFLAVLVVVTRYLLMLGSLFAAGVERGTIRLSGFEPEWAGPTYRIVRVAVIGFAAVVAYPYIPGAESAAFKGMSIFFGVIFSLGASSVVGNLLAGYSLIYRGTFRVGDRVKIGDVIGDVTIMRLQVTHLRTIKNEDVIVPNSSILTSQVVNYSSYAGTDGLILHTTVGIGYETPWRQVEAMLRLAASRTQGLRTSPPPFVLQTSLGDFAINYELNVYCGDAHAMAPLYTALHRNIQDVFNEYGVQIMTPNYEADPAVPKVVPKGQWYQEPARPPEEPQRNAAG
jgi:small-conductance mechanosensitive channel